MPNTVAAPALPPGAAVDLDTVRAAAARMTPLSDPVAEHGEQAVRAWRQIGTFYLAPETPVLLAALDPVGPLTETAAYRILGLGAALTTWVDGAEPIIEEMRRLATGGPVTPEQAARMAELIEHLAAVEQACAAAIRRLGESSLRPAKVRTGEQVESTEGGLSAGIVTLDSGAAFKVTTFSDGTVAITAVSSGGLGATGSLGGLVDLGGGLTVESGSTWRFQDGDEAARMIDDLKRYVEQRRRPAPAGKGAFPIAALIRPPRPPDVVITESGLQGSVGGELDVGAAQAGLAVDGNVKETIIRDRTNGTTISVLGAEGSVAVERALGIGAGPGVGADEKDTAGLARSVTKDATGKIIRIQLTDTRTGTDTLGGSIDGPRDASGGKHRAPAFNPNGGVSGELTDSTVTVTTTTLEVNDGNRALVQEWVDAGRPDRKGLLVDSKLHRPDTAVPGEDFQNLLYREAKVSEATYTDSSVKKGFEAELKAGGKVGASAASEQTSSRLVEASHLGAPGPDGVRRPVRDPDQVN